MSTNIANMTISILITTIFLATFSKGTAAASAAPPGVDCTSLVLNLADCLSFVSAGSTVEKPEGTCCPGLKMVLKSHAECLCEAFKNSAQFGVTLNVSKALSLPAACHVSSPSISNCGCAPASAPLGAMSPTTTSGSPTSAPGFMEAAAPVPAPGSSGSSALVFSMGILLISIVAVSFSF